MQQQQQQQQEQQLVLERYEDKIGRNIQHQSQFVDVKSNTTFPIRIEMVVAASSIHMFLLLPLLITQYSPTNKNKKRNFVISQENTFKMKFHRELSCRRIIITESFTHFEVNKNELI